MLERRTTFLLTLGLGALTVCAQTASPPAHRTSAVGIMVPGETGHIRSSGVAAMRTKAGWLVLKRLHNKKTESEAALERDAAILDRDSLIVEGDPSVMVLELAPLDYLGD
jgi:hypothetical protein